MTEKYEAIVRSQAMLMLYRNNGKKKIIKKIINRFLKCIKG